MTMFGGASFEVTADVQAAIRAFLELRTVAQNAFKEISEVIAEEAAKPGFTAKLSTAAKDFEVLGEAVKSVDSILRNFESAGKGIDLADRFREARAVFQDLRNDLAKGLGETSAKEEEALQASLFKQQTQAAHEVALVKEETFARSKQQAEEELTIQEELFLQATQTAHETAKAKEEAFLVAKKVIVEERAIQEALFRSATQGAHEVAVAKEQAYARAAKAAEINTARELKAQEQLGARLATSINRINPQLLKENNRQFDLLVGKASGVSEATGKMSHAFDSFAKRGGLAGSVAGKLGGLLGAAEGALGKFGLSISNVSVLLGAGFAGGIAGIIQVGIAFIQKIGEMIKAVAKFAQAAAFLSSHVNQLRDNINATFGPAGDAVQRFAERSTFAFGVSETAALEYLNSFGQLLTQFGLAEDEVARLSTGLFSVADSLRRGKEATVSAAEALQFMRDTLAGNIEGLRKLDVRLSDIGLQKLAKDLGVNLTGALDDTQRALLAIIAASDVAKDRLIRLPDTARTLSEKFEIVKNTFERITRSIGDELVPVFDFLADVAIGFAVTLLVMIDGFKNFVKAINEFINRHLILQKALEAMKNTLLAMFPALFVYAKVLGVVADKGEEAQESAKNFADELETITGVQEEATRILREYAEAQQLTVENLDELAEAHQRLQRAVEDGARSIENAELSLARAREDAVRNTEEAQRKVADAYRDRNEKIGDANRKLQEVESQNARALTDAENKLSDARLDRRRALRDAEEKLADERKGFAKRVADAQEKLEKARVQRLEAILRAQLAVQNAQFRFTTVAFNQAQLELTQARQSDSVKEASLALDEAISEGKEKLARLERDLSEERIDQNKKVAEAEEDLRRVVEDNSRRMADAKRELARTIEDTARRIIDAQRDLAETEIENSRRLFDARRALEEATRRAAQNIADARDRVQELNEKFGTTDMTLGQILDKLEKMKNAAIGIAKLAEIWPDFDPTTFRPAPPPPHLAHGFRNFPGGLAMVGERGRELVNLPRGSDVISNDQTEKLLAALGKGGNTVNVYEVANDPKATAFMVAAELMQGVNQ